MIRNEIRNPMHARKAKMMRTFSLILLAGTILMFLACGLSDGGQEAHEGDEVEPLVASATPAGTAPAVETKTPAGTVSPPVATETTTGTASPPVAAETPAGTEAPLSAAPVLYTGPTSLEERIFASPVIARVRLDSVSSAAESGTTRLGMKYIATLEFSFSVHEYLKGTGPDDVVAVWNAGQIFDTRQEAEDALPAIAAARDARWDDREAVVFLKNSQTYLPSTQQVGRFYLSGEHEVGSVLDDYYSLASRGNKLWLPAAAGVGVSSPPSGDQQRFLMDVPPDMGTSTASTITLGEIKTRIAAVIAKLAAGDGSEEYTECVRETYYLERRNRHRRETQPDTVYRASNISPPLAHQFSSGLGVGTVVYEIPEGDPITPGVPFEVWLDGGDAGLFSVASPSQDYRVTTTRPLPAGTYGFHFNYRGPYYGRCDGYAFRNEWTVMVNAPAGTLHEAFFDPVTDGSAVAADSANGVLKPATFTDANGASATLERIAWEPGTGDSGTLKLKANPHTGLTDHAVDFIALDGSVALSLKIADATVDAANRTLSWTVASQPWQSGDQLMLRIRKGCGGGTAVTNPGANPGLVSDCEALLSARDTLRGTATLDWAVTTAIGGWEGITTGGIPARVTRLELPDEGLDGSIPAELVGPYTSSVAASRRFTCGWPLISRTGPHPIRTAPGDGGSPES